jgi:Tfp pilus assembly protein PilF
VYARRGAAEEATAAFDDALATGRASAWTYEQFGDLQHTLGNETRARRYWRKALDQAPDRTALKEKLQSSPTS